MLTKGFIMDFNRILSWIKDIFLSGAFDFLEEVDEEVLSPLALILNVDAKNLSSICKILPPLFKGQLSFKDLLPTIIPILLPLILSKRINGSLNKVNSGEVFAKNSEKPTYSPTFEENKTASDFISSFADNDIYYSINTYFESDNAS